MYQYVVDFMFKFEGIFFKMYTGVSLSNTRFIWEINYKEYNGTNNKIKWKTKNTTLSEQF